MMVDTDIMDTGKWRGKEQKQKKSPQFKYYVSKLGGGGKIMENMLT